MDVETVPSRSKLLLENLSDEARAVVSASKHRLLVIAGAGAGKTEAMARRIAWWHAVEGVRKDNIVRSPSRSARPRR